MYLCLLLIFCDMPILARNYKITVRTFKFFNMFTLIENMFVSTLAQLEKANILHYTSPTPQINNHTVHNINFT